MYHRVGFTAAQRAKADQRGRIPDAVSIRERPASVGGSGCAGHWELAAILTNSETATALLDSSASNVDELRQILIDIRRDNQRASDALHRVRGFLKKAPAAMLAAMTPAEARSMNAISFELVASSNERGFDFRYPA